MMSYTAIKVENLGKMYYLNEDISYSSLADRLRFLLPLKRKTPRQTFWALRDVNFDIAAGDVVGFVGHNGAGKSTLLKILSKISEPSTGRVRIRGKVGTLLEVGTGFHPELTGKENIYLNGSILGMTRRDITKKLDEIVEFSGVEQFLDTPLKRYSSGMQVRLAFSVAAHLDTDILLVDEVLAVGDAEFQRKCLNTMSNLANVGRTVLFVSHSMTAIQELCPRTIHLARGQVVEDGETDVALANYIESYHQKNTITEIEDIPRAREDLGIKARITNVRVLNSGSLSTNTLKRSEDFYVEISCRLLTQLEDATFLIGFDSVYDQRILTVTGFEAGMLFSGRAGEVFRGCLHISNVTFMPGRYYLTVAIIQRKKGLDHLDKVISVDFSEVQFDKQMDGRIQYGYMQLVKPNWEIKEVSNEHENNYENIQS